MDTTLEQALSAVGQIPLDRQPTLGVYVDLALADMQFDPHDPLRRFAMGTAGAFFTKDGVQWIRLLDTGALPGLQANAIMIGSPNRRLLGSAGRGLVKIGLM
jgi:hypothetical protein